MLRKQRNRLKRFGKNINKKRIIELIPSSDPLWSWIGYIHQPYDNEDIIGYNAMVYKDFTSNNHFGTASKTANFFVFSSSSLTSSSASTASNTENFFSSLPSSSLANFSSSLLSSTCSLRLKNVVTGIFSSVSTDLFVVVLEPPSAF